MYKLLVQSTLLLHFLASQRCSASPAVYSVEASTENLKEHDDSNTIDVNGRGPRQHLDCQAESGYIQEQISLITKMLDDGQKVAEKQRDLSAADETVLVVGEAGSGKTSLVQFLTENPRLQSKKVRSDTGEYIIEDGEKIGTSATESFTLYPEIVNYNATISFCDSPGFHDSRSSAHEIVSMDVMKSVTSKLKKVKILLLERHGSLQYGVSKDNFINTLQHLDDFLVDIDRYKDHIALIATKIPLTYITTDDINVVSGIVTEEMHIESIMDYLNLTETNLAEKLNEKIGRKQRDFYQKVIKLLQSLQTRDENGKATRISVFSRPYIAGPLINMALLNENKESLTKIINNLNAVEVKENDFDYTLSNEAKMYIECLLRLTSDNFKKKINELSFKLNEFVTLKTQNYTSFRQVLLDLKSFYDALKQLSQNLDDTKNYNEFFEKLNGFISEQKISSHINYNEQIHVLERYEEMLMKFVDTDLVFSPSSWTLPIRQVKKSAEDELQWYESLNNFINGLASYKMQENKTEIHSSIFHEGSIVTNELMHLFVNITGDTNLKQFMDAQADTRKRTELEGITNTLLKPSDITCDENGRLIVKGVYIRLAEINSEDLVQSHCNNINVKEAALLAVDTVYLDEDTEDVFRGANLFIAAPKWEVIGQRRIVLSGQNGAQHSGDELFVDYSKDGRPGLPGGNGGSFLGIGLQFVNGVNLLIESNGGIGGPGSDGEKGERGPDGREAVQKLKSSGGYNHSYIFNRGVFTWNFEDSFDSYSRDTAFTLYTENCYSMRCKTNVDATVEVVTEDGDCGGDGGVGGFGGEAGIGGLAGDQQLIELGDSSHIGMQNQNGSIGTRGKMGEAGDCGKDGVGVICVRVSTNSMSYWKCKPTDTTSPTCKTCQKQEIAVEEYQYITTGIEEPAPKNTPGFTNYLLDYTVFLEAHTNHTIFNPIITDFREAIQKKFSYTLNDLGLLFSKEEFHKKDSDNPNDL